MSKECNSSGLAFERKQALKKSFVNQIANEKLSIRVARRPATRSERGKFARRSLTGFARFAFTINMVHFYHSLADGVRD